MLFFVCLSVCPVQVCLESLMSSLLALSFLFQLSNRSITESYSRDLKYLSTDQLISHDNNFKYKMKPFYPPKTPAFLLSVISGPPRKM